MKALKHPLLWIVISMLLSIRMEAQTAHYLVGYQSSFNGGEFLTYHAIASTQYLNLNTLIDVSQLTNAYNMLQLRFKDDQGYWSSIMSQPIIKVPAGTLDKKKLIAYEYRFNQGENVHYVPISPQNDLILVAELDASGLSNTLNILNIRFQDDSGMWSSYASQFVVVIPDGVSAKKNIVAYQYAFNEGEFVTEIPISPQMDYVLITEITPPQLTNSLNTFHIRFKDESGMWSSYASQFVVVIPDGVSANKNIVAYQYAFNEGEFVTEIPISPQMDYVLITEITSPQLTNSLNTFHIRFKDESGMYSSYVTEFYLYQPPTPDALDNKLTSYTYWFSVDGSKKREIDINPNSPDLSVHEIDVQDLWEGDYTLHTQYKDVLGRHSMVTSENFHKNIHPMALFSVDNDAVCEGETVTFTNEYSVDFDTVLYNFGDGQTSTSLNTSHVYNTFGTYNATMTVTDTGSGMQNTSSKTIQVYKVPDNQIVANNAIPACFGTTVNLQASEPGMNYLWSNGNTTQSIDVALAGNYSVVITNPNHTNCQVTSNTIVVSFKPEINTNITLQEFPLLLTANQTNATYQWIDCTNGNISINGATQASYEPTINGNYAVQITQNGCTVTSNCVTISTVNIADYEIKQLVKMYPNPTNAFVNFNTEIAIEVTIYNATGAMIWKGNFDKGINTFDITNMSSGLYLTKITAQEGAWENQSAVHRLIRE